MSQIRKQIQGSDDVNIRVNKRMRYTEDGIPVTTLSLRPLEKEVTATQLHDYFSKFGAVDNTQIKSLGYATFGLVTFTHAESAAQALEVKRHYFAGHSTTVAVAASLHQDKTIEDDLTVELTNLTGTCLLDLNEDCLWKMFSLKYLGLMDLCSVAETCSRLKEVTMEIFRRKHKVWYFNEWPKIKIDEERRIFFNFGSLLTEIQINLTRSLNQRSTQIMDLVITYCSNTLKSLTLINCKIDEDMTKRFIPLLNRLEKLYFDDVDMTGDCMDLLANSETLVELTVLDTYSRLWCEKIGENTFPKLKKIDYYHVYCTMYNWENFILRHKTLKTISLGCPDDFSSLLPIISENCRQLEKLEIRAGFEKVSTVDYERTLKSFIKLDYLKVLKLHCNGQNATKFIRELHLLKSLEFLELLYAVDVCEFTSDLSLLNKLKDLRLTNCYEPKNLNHLSKLHRLTGLAVDIDDDTFDPDFNVVGMVERLINLENLEIWTYGFEMDRNTYLRIVQAVQSRPDGANRTLVLSCRKDFTLDNNNCQSVKFRE